MTYCLGMLLDRGLVMMADSRTNAGVDNFSCYRKLHCLLDEEGRQIYAATAGNLSTSQTVISLMREGMPADDDRSFTRSLADVGSMFRAAQLVGEAVRTANEAVGDALEALNIPGRSSLLLGGRIGKDPPRLFMIYEAGNFIECTPDVPFLQIGETKYGRPILDRVVNAGTPLAEAVKIGLLSFDSSMRSNLAVARPIDVMVMEKDPDQPVLTRRIGADDSYFNDLSSRWSRLLHEATRAVPDPPFMQDPAA
jgi:putative proteasome-type protease